MRQLGIASRTTSKKAIVCVLSGCKRRGNALLKQLDEFGIATSVLVDSVAAFEKSQPERSFTLLLVDRSIEASKVPMLLKVSEDCPVATFGVSPPASEEIRSLESAAIYQLRHPLATIDLERLFSYVDRHAPATEFAPSNRSAHLYRGLVRESEAIVQLRELIEKIAASKSTVLISGETGTGKGIVARNIHYYSDQSCGPFVPVNCSAIPPDLLESELFGHKKGAFTGALTEHAIHVK